ncbi:hypothetical protein [Vannielia litorea]|uniref:hypothetical protein n=1 Tax=Vannielia litorea TaxID=1217970 RepID=UPI001BCE1348|nr:hypothetical protein [Vannielia litorea]MBS8226135.1 hypothetical protein [Vannielia litorea]
MSLIEDVRSAISTAAMQHLSFTVAGRNVTPAIYQPVRDKIADGTITAQRAGPAGVCGVYQFGPNRFDLGFVSVDGDPWRAALVVHESTHAAFDYINQPMPVKVSEALAYIAQALYFYHSNREAIEESDELTFSEPLNTAYAVSAPARSEAHSFTDEELAPLYAAIDADAHYHGRGDDNEGIDGIA